MIDDFATCIQSARSWTRVSTFELMTSSVRWAFIVYYTLWSAIGRCPLIFFLARAHCLIIDVLALTVGATRRWITRLVNGCLGR